MPRGERPLDEGESELLRFAADLRRLREKAGGPPYRELSRRAHYSAAALSEAAGGRRAPTLAVTLAYVQACDGDVVEWETRWRELAQPDDRPATDESPYVGLAAFQTADAERFFGRERLTAELVELVGQRRFVGVFGASGSGKSSVLRAGLVPALETPVLVFAPGAHPVDECAVRLAGLTCESAVVLKQELAADPANLRLRIRQFDEDLLLVVDQFEEVFTLAPAEEREWLIAALTEAPRVVIGVRSDFYPHCERHTGLVGALRGGQVMVGPMSTEELRRAIVEPALAVGAKVETALVARLVADAAGQAAVLPLLSHALVETWQRRRGITLSLHGYMEAGGVEHAIARTAEHLYSTLSGTEKIAVRHVFLRLIALGDGPDDTKRRVSRHEIDSDQLLEELAAARLITLDRDHVELAHEALIRSWPRLRQWLDEDREGLRIHRQLTDAPDAWEAHGRDSGALYRGTRLTIAKKWHTPERGLSDREADFLTASIAEEDAGQLAARRRVSRRRRGVLVLVVLIFVGFGTIGSLLSVGPKENAEKQRKGRMAELAVTAATELRNTDPALALQLVQEAYRMTRTPEMAGRLSEMAALTYYLRFRLPDGTIPEVRVGDDAELSLVRGRDVAQWALFDLKGGGFQEIKGRPVGDLAVHALPELGQHVRETGLPVGEADRAAERICSVTRPVITAGQWARYFTGEPYAPLCAEIS
ncbi:hypothetical protein FKR81_12220 [Lentzea tibetensis]|uniref:HTH cro/C1-type domain-containing protein n=1 Tax=Lentzea tibetensis TaxID=2591470 RepID=A0A563EXN3_9PSEU|nr:ATP-binding protein [Lentzea tibetensis]TWP52322.1 hypothetical protein FKR81_12220 [Lentzea tibetensis]